MGVSKRLRGYTLSELLISLAVLGVVSLYLTDMLTQQSRTYSVVDSVTEVQQNVRAIASLIEREARATAFMAPEAAAVCGLDAVGASDVLFVTDADALMRQDNDYNIGAPILAGYTGTANNDLLTLGPADLFNPLANPMAPDNAAFYDTNGDNTPDSDFRGGAGLIVVDRSNPDRGSSCGIITNVDLGANQLMVDFRLGGAAPGGMALAALPLGASEDLVAVPAHVYRLFPDPANLTTNLVRDGLLLSQDVEDLQFALFYDTDGDGVVDPGEYQGETAATRYFSNVWDNRNLREIRVSFVARSKMQDLEFGANGLPQGRFQLTENRADPGLPNDQFRRRVYTTTVRPRNVGHRKHLGSS